MENNKEHWDKVYGEKPCTETSWYEPMPETSLTFIIESGLEKDAAIIDIGAGDCILVEFLLARGYTNLTVLDISEKAVARAKERLGERAKEIEWIVADASNFKHQKQYDLWHDRATFHFLTSAGQVENYLSNLKQAVKPGGFVILGAFSETGPSKCSGLEIKQYSVMEMQQLFAEGFTTINCRNFDHKTPLGKVQNFTFCSFKKEKNLQ